MIGIGVRFVLGIMTNVVGNEVRFVLGIMTTTMIILTIVFAIMLRRFVILVGSAVGSIDFSLVCRMFKPP